MKFDAGTKGGVQSGNSQRYSELGRMSDVERKQQPCQGRRKKYGGDDTDKRTKTVCRLNARKVENSQQP